MYEKSGAVKTAAVAAAPTPLTYDQQFRIYEHLALICRNQP